MSSVAADGKGGRRLNIEKNRPYFNAVPAKITKKIITIGAP